MNTRLILAHYSYPYGTTSIWWRQKLARNPKYINEYGHLIKNPCRKITDKLFYWNVHGTVTPRVMCTNYSDVRMSGKCNNGETHGTLRGNIRWSNRYVHHQRAMDGIPSIPKRYKQFSFCRAALTIARYTLTIEHTHALARTHRTYCQHYLHGSMALLAKLTQ